MLINFSINNWMSFYKDNTFSMIASKERQYGKRLVNLKKYQTRILPIASIYGGNASGKTNFFKALQFVQKFILKGVGEDSLIPVQSFKLIEDSFYSEAVFTIEVFVEGLIYCLKFSVNKEKVFRESLTVITSTSEKVLYQRNCNEIEFHSSLRSDSGLKFAFDGTNDNQLFITNATQQKRENFLPVYNWFKNKLRLLSPDSRFGGFENLFNSNDQIVDQIQSTIKKLDTGIDHFGIENIAIDQVKLPQSVKEEIIVKLKDGNQIKLTDRQTRESYVFERIEGKVVVSKIVTFHKDSIGDDVKFELSQESDGSLRVMDLLPAFLQLGNSDGDCVYIIDELDRSLHSKLTRELIRMYLNSCNNESRTQLIFTTHDLQLMDQSLFRRDEMWTTERDKSTGNSTLIAFSDYKDIRYDKDIRKSYLQGRFGGMPDLKVMEIENDYGEHR